jgi:hypothetical protein
VSTGEPFVIREEVSPALVMGITMGGDSRHNIMERTALESWMAKDGAVRWGGGSGAERVPRIQHAPSLDLVSSYREYPKGDDPGGCRPSF